jgi:bifunctional DNA-binding transcriptional regulator/antitoxin component of YhaV-PrlF toxin-antitoxin module
MKLTIKGQVTIPKKYRQRYGLTPHVDVVFEEAPGGVLIRAAGPAREEKIRKSLKKVRGIADAGLSTDAILGKTREA